MSRQINDFGSFVYVLYTRPISCYQLTMHIKRIALILLVALVINSAIPFNLVQAQGLNLPGGYSTPTQEYSPADPLEPLKDIKTRDLTKENDELVNKNSSVINNDSTLKKSVLFGAGVITSVVVGIGIATLAAAASPALAIGLGITAGMLAVIGTVQLLKSAHDSYKVGGTKQVWADAKAYTSENPFTAGSIVGGYVCLAVCGVGSKGLNQFINSPRISEPIITKTNEPLLTTSAKATALKALDKLPNEIQTSVKSFFKSGSNKYDSFSVTKGQGNEYIAKMSKPGDVPGSRADYIKIISKDGKTIRVYKNSYLPNGQLIHTKEK